MECSCDQSTPRINTPVVALGGLKTTLPHGGTAGAMRSRGGNAHAVNIGFQPHLLFPPSVEVQGDAFKFGGGNNDRPVAGVRSSFKA